VKATTSQVLRVLTFALLPCLLTAGCQPARLRTVMKPRTKSIAPASASSTSAPAYVPNVDIPPPTPPGHSGQLRGLYAHMEVPSPDRPGWTLLETGLGLKLEYPPGWVVRGVEPDYVAVRPGSFAAAPDNRPDGVDLTTTGAYLSYSDFERKLGAIGNAARGMKAQHLTLGRAIPVTLASLPATAIVGTSGARTSIVVASAALVVHGEIRSDAPRSGLTRDNVLGVLASIGLVGQVLP
jgi:hypothetical protein